MDKNDYEQAKNHFEDLITTYFNNNFDDLLDCSLNLIETYLRVDFDLDKNVTRNVFMIILREIEQHMNNQKDKDYKNMYDDYRIRMENFINTNFE
jgi:hypothetical protein